MDRTVNRPFFSRNMLLLVVLIVLGGWLVSEWLARALYAILF
jgi:hypothetical protein